MKETLDKIVPYLMTYGMNIVAALVIFAVGRWVAVRAAALLERLMLAAKINKTLASFGKHVTFFTLLVFVVIAALNKLGVETTSFIAILGAAGLAVGLALQGSLANFAAGVLLILFQTFQVGDYIEAQGAQGTVEEIQIFNTIIVTRDKKRIIIPNAKLTGDKIIVYPAPPES